MKKRTIISLALILIVVLVTAPSINLASTLRKPLSPKPAEAIAYNYSNRARENSKALRKPLALGNRARKLSQEATAIGQSVTLLPDGSLLLVGGQGPDGPLATAFVRQAANDRINSLPNGLQRARTRHTATVLPDGTVLILGGIGADGQILDTAELFDPATLMFRLLSSAITPRADHTATLLTDGKVLIAGGISRNGKFPVKAELWDPLSNSSLSLPSTLHTPRFSHTSSLMPDGNVLLLGGMDNNSPLFDSEIFDPHSMQFIPSGNFTDKPDPNPPFLAASLPDNGESSVPTDFIISVRFSKPLRVETINSATFTLSSNQSNLAVKVVAAESGRLAFIIPLHPLLPHSVYTVSLLDSTDIDGLPLAPTYFSFTTVGSDDHEHSSSQKNLQRNRNNLLGSPFNDFRDDETWQPDPLNPYDNWRSDRPESDWQNLPALQAQPGLTALSGRVLKLNGNPLANVTLQIGSTASRTDSTGRFILTGLSPGRQPLLINGASASHGKKLYASFRSGADIVEGQTNLLPYTIWLPLVDTSHITRLSVPTTSETVISTPLIPGLEIRIPKGVTLRAHDGTAVTEISITPIPVDRTPWPLPAGARFFFNPQAHGASVELAGGGASSGIRIIYPNVTGEEAGSPVQLFDYDALKGWYLYGEATVSKDGKQVLPNQGVGLQQLKCGYYMYGSGAPSTAPPPGSCALDGDPVDLATGLFIDNHSDLALPNSLPLILSRTYRQNDSADRSFGKGSSNPYDIYLWFIFWSAVDLVLPDGSKIHFDAITGGYQHTATPTVFYKSTLSGTPAAGYDLRLKDGTIYHFTFKTVTGSVSSYIRAPLESIQDRFGNRLVITRDTTPDLRIKCITTPNGRWAEFSYDSTSPRISLVRDNLGRAVSYTYDASGRLWKVTDPLGGVTEYTYDTSHRMLTIKNPRAIVYVTNEYDANGRVSKQTHADGGIYQFAYTLDGGGKVSRTDVTDPRGNVRRVNFNSSHYTLSEIYALGKPEQQTYNFGWQSATNLLLSITDALGRSSALTYDLMGNATSITNLVNTSEAVTTSYTYEPTFNQVASITDHLNHTSTFTYDSRGNLTSVTDPLSNRATYSYNSFGQLTGMTNAEMQTWQFAYTGGDCVRITNPMGNAITRFVDAAGRATRLTNALGHSVQYEYDVVNRPLRTIDPLQGITNFSYNENNSLLNVTDARSNSVSYAYDNMDRAVTRTDPLSHSDGFLYDGVGNLVQATDRKGQITSYTYDALSRLTLVTFADSSSIAYTYDVGNRLTQITDSASGTITYGYDNRDRLTSEASSQGTVSYAYDAAGRLTSRTAPGQSVVNYTYDNANRLMQITQGSATVTMAYDHIGRCASQTQPNSVTTEYTYDGASHLTGIVYKKGATVLGNLTYSYDAAGRRVGMGGSYARTGLPQAVASTSHNSANQQTGFGAQTLTYDLNGNLTGDGINTYTWNARDELISIAGPGLAASFQYDAVGRRIGKTINGTTTGFLYDGGNVVQEQSGGSATANILGGGTDQFFSRSDSSGTSSPIVDALGSPIALTDSSGIVQTDYTYEPFGKTAASGATSGNPSQFTGRENDSTGLYYYRARYYSPSLQRFISEDPAGLLAVAAVSHQEEKHPIRSCQGLEM